MIVFALALALRIVADTASSLEWLRWASPLGWAEEVRAFTGARPVVLLLPALSTVVLLYASARISLRRDVGTGVLADSDRAAPRLRLLSGPTALVPRNERGTLFGWLAGIALYAVIVGVLANTFSVETISKSVREQLHKVGATVVTPTGAIGFYFLIFVFAISLFACAQVSAAFCWYLFGALLGVPQWTLDLSPFQHVALVPAQSFKLTEALIMLAAAALAIAAALWAFERRDVLGD